MEMIEYVKLVTAFIVSIGGSSVVIIALSKWFGNFLSTRLLDSYNNKHEKELEVIKTKQQMVDSLLLVFTIIVGIISYILNFLYCHLI